MGASLSLSISVSNTSDTAATVKVTLKVKSTSGSWNSGSQYGYISIDGTKYEFHHSFSANKTTTLATKSKSITRTTANKSISVKGYYKTGVSPGNISKSSSTTVSARPTYSVTFNANGGTGTKTVSVYSGYTTTFPTTTRTGYIFGSWNGYAQGASTPAITSSRTYTASWTEASATLSYNANGYGTAPANDTMWYTTQTTAKNMDSVSGSGYHFTNWNTSIDGTGINYNANATVKAANVVPSNITLYAQWAINTYTIKLDLGEADGSGSVDPTQLTKTHGVALPLPTPTWNRPFVGWSYNDSNIGSVCNVDGDVNSDDIDLVALWSEEVRPVIYHYWDSVTNINSTYQTYKIIGNVLTLSIPKVTNYVFKGWYTDSNFSGESITTISNEYDYPTGDSRYQDPEPIHLYAKWNETYTIVYNVNNPSYNDGIEAMGDISSVIVENGESIILPSSSAFTYGEGQCIASGWSETAGDNTIVYRDGYSLTLSNKGAGYVLNLYAAWAPNTYTITLKSGTGTSGNDVTISQNYYTTYTLPSKELEEWEWTPTLNYHLSNWLDSSNKKIPVGNVITITGNVTYTAEWINSYHVPVVQDPIKTERYLDAGYTVLNPGGKYLRIIADGTNGLYDEATVELYTYTVDVKFYASEDYENEEPVATYTLPLESPVTSTRVFHQEWGVSTHPLIDKRLEMVYCVLTITDTTSYIINGQPATITKEGRTFTYEFAIELERMIAFHIADDLHAISVFKELEDKDEGLVINGPMNLQRAWIWDMNPITQTLVLRWGGNNEE